LDFGFWIEEKEAVSNHNPMTIVTLVRRMAKITTEIQEIER
jgi:hypothetical protein